MTFWETLVALAVGPAAVVAAVAFLVRKLVDHGLTRDIETFKNELALKRYEFQTRFSIIHQKRAEVIGEFYGKLVRAAMRMQSLTVPLQFGGQNLKQKKEITGEACEQAETFFQEHRIYLTEDEAAQAEQIFNVIRHAFSAFDVGQSGEEYSRDDTGMWLKAWDEINKVLPPLRKNLEASFRRALTPGEQGET